MLHLIKLCVGCDTVEELLEWRSPSRLAGEPWILRTRHTPRLAADLLAGGSLYRVFRGFILSQQRILAIQTIGKDAARRCEIRLDERVVPTVPTPRRAFQGWRYLHPEDAPLDLPAGRSAGFVPASLALELRQIGAW